jgi:hypothetical protein
MGFPWRFGSQWGPDTVPCVSGRDKAQASCCELAMTQAPEILEPALQLSDAEKEQLVEALAVGDGVGRS